MVCPGVSQPCCLFPVVYGHQTQISFWTETFFSCVKCNGNRLDELPQPNSGDIFKQGRDRKRFSLCLTCASVRMLLSQPGLLSWFSSLASCPSEGIFKVLPWNQQVCKPEGTLARREARGTATLPQRRQAKCKPPCKCAVDWVRSVFSGNRA